MSRIGVTATLSFVGVLLAATAAAAVNIQVLGAASAVGNSTVANAVLQTTDPVALTAVPEVVVTGSTRKGRKAGQVAGSRRTANAAASDGDDGAGSQQSSGGRPARAAGDSASVGGGDRRGGSSGSRGEGSSDQGSGSAVGGTGAGGGGSQGGSAGLDNKPSGNDDPADNSSNNGRDD